MAIAHDDPAGSAQWPGINLSFTIRISDYRFVTMRMQKSICISKQQPGCGHHCGQYIHQILARAFVSANNKCDLQILHNQLWAKTCKSYKFCDLHKLADISYMRPDLHRITADLQTRMRWEDTHKTFLCDLTRQVDFWEAENKMILDRCLNKD